MNEILPKASISLVYHRICYWISSHLEGRFWLWKLVIICAGISFFLAVPAFSVIKDADAWVYIKLQAEDMLKVYDLGHYIRRENMVYRLFLPVLAMLTGKSILVILAIQYLLALVFLYIFSREIFRQTQDKALTAFFALAVANMFFFSWFFIDVVGYGDAFAYFFMLLALLYKNPLAVFLSLMCVFFTDERGVVAGGYLLLGWLLYAVLEKYPSRNSIPDLFKTVFSLSNTWVLIAAWMVYYGLRTYLGKTYFPHHYYSTIEGPVLFNDAHRGGLGHSLWSAFEGSWLLLGVAAYSLWMAGRYWLLLGLFAGFIVLIITGLHVHDVDRAFGYGFPFFLMASLILSKYLALHEYRKIAFIVAIVCVLHPMLYTLGYNRVIWAEPLPLKAMMYFDRVIGLGWF